ncbi:MAG: hypothetical protein HQL04_03695 [Nitrospirae bacterium]|nr:hypothetical protein [Nitrospirota bacterium]
MSEQLKWVKGVTGILSCMLLMVVLTVQVARGEDDPVVARIGETVITLSRFKAQAKQALNARDRLSTQRLYDLLDDMMAGILFSKEAVEEGLDKEPENMTALKGVPEDKRVNILANLYKNKLLTVQRPTEQEAADFYVNNLGMYNTPKIYNGFMFGVSRKTAGDKDSKDNDKNYADTCKEAAEGIYNRITAKDYETVVKLRDDFTEKHPELNILFTPLSYWEGKIKGSPYDNALKEFMQLQPGQVKLVLEKDMYVIVSLLGTYEPSIYKFEEIRSRVISDMERNRYQEKHNEALKRLSEKYKLQVYPQHIEQLLNEQKGKSEVKSNE